MTAQVLEDARALAVLPRSWLLEDAGAEVARLPERLVHVRYAPLDHLCADPPRRRRRLIAVDVGDDDSAVGSDTQLSTVRVSDSHPLRESEGGLQPRHRS